MHKAFILPTRKASDTVNDQRAVRYTHCSMPPGSRGALLPHAVSRQLTESQPAHSDGNAPRVNMVMLDRNTGPAKSVVADLVRCAAAWVWQAVMPLPGRQVFGCPLRLTQKLILFGDFIEIRAGKEQGTGAFFVDAISI